MKALVTLTPETASSRIRPAVSAARDRSERRGSDISYFPGCRKDTNCHCEICLASIDATRDLIPSGGSIKLSVSTPTPSPFLARSPPPSPETGSTVTPPSTPVIESWKRSRPSAKAVAKKEESWGLSCRAVRILVGLFLLWAADMGLSAVIMKDFGSKLTPEVVSRAGEECRVLGNDLKGILELLQQRMEKLVGGRASNCGFVDSFWEMNPGGNFFFQWRCVVYKSIAEEVNVWGSPLRTAGLLSAGASPRSLTLVCKHLGVGVPEESFASEAKIDSNSMGGAEGDNREEHEEALEAVILAARGTVDAPNLRRYQFGANISLSVLRLVSSVVLSS
ncbi:hypothetical protein BHE74_00045361 [Ensete ventricosum]|nr:hypothetical protein BHE74_00045361 [Ensete ventricosum]RZS03241.1 hypothetical protein BHM03_00033395 [Ensete ventricosum]